MFDFLKGLVVWLAKYLLFLFFPAIGWIVFFFENFPETVKSIWNYCLKAIIWYFQDAYTWFFDWLSTKLNTVFSEHDFALSVVEFSDGFFTQMNVFLPMNETFACLTFIVATQATVFLLRIILKAIPTIW